MTCNFTKNRSTPQLIIPNRKTHHIFSFSFVFLVGKKNITTKKLSFHANQCQGNGFRLVTM